MNTQPALTDKERAYCAALADLGFRSIPPDRRSPELQSKFAAVEAMETELDPERVTYFKELSLPNLRRLIEA